MLNHIRNMQQRRTEDGASAVEYGLLVAAIAALIVLIVFVLGGLIEDKFTETCSSIKSGGTTSSSTTC